MDRLEAMSIVLAVAAAGFAAWVQTHFRHHESVAGAVIYWR